MADIKELIPKAIAAFGDRNLTIGIGTDDKHLRATEVTTELFASTIFTIKEGAKGEGDRWSPFAFTDGHRLKTNAESAELMVLDVDIGYRLEDITCRLDILGWAALVAPTASYGKTTSQEVQTWRYDVWAANHKAPSITEFMVADGWMLPWLAATINDTERVTVARKFKRADGSPAEVNQTYLKVTHDPKPKFRVILPLAKPWRAADYQDQEAASAAWERAYQSVADALELQLDETSKETARLFYLTRCSEDRVNAALGARAVMGGQPCDPWSLPPPRPREPLHLPLSRPSSPHDRIQHSGDRIHYQATDGARYDLSSWAKDHARDFQIADALTERGQIELDERGKHDGKLHIACPFDDEHSTPTGGGTFVVNAADTKRAEGFIVYCAHNACRCHSDHGRDRLEYLARMLEQGTLTVEDLPGLEKAAEAIDWMEVISPSLSPAVGEKKSRLYVIPFAECAVDLGQVPLIDGWLDQRTLAVMYGDSNAGKTFVALDMAFHIATGTPWLGCEVEQGDVIYVAAEAGLSIQKRIVALRLKHGIVGDIPLWLVPCPVDLLDPTADTQGLIDLIQTTTGGKARLVVIDTLSRAMPGGNENASEAMSAIVRNCDRIRIAVDATTMLVHHIGKDASKGARGHSSLRAATDTEIEIKDGMIRTTKQRDGEIRKPIPFQLEVVDLGVSVRGKTVTSCVVTAGDAASKTLPVITPRMQLVLAAFQTALEQANAAGRAYVSMEEWYDAALSVPGSDFPEGAKYARRAVRSAVENLGRLGIVVSLETDKFISMEKDDA